MGWTEIIHLVERAQIGDREAYGELVTRFQGSVYAMALARVRNPLEAQELAQDVFVHAMKKLPQLREPRGGKRQIPKSNASASHPCHERSGLPGHHARYGEEPVSRANAGP